MTSDAALRAGGAMAELGQAGPLSLEQARRRAWTAGSAASGAAVAERVALGDAAGRVLAEAMRARVDLPGFASAAMDGWAVAGAGPWRLGPAILVGAGPTASLTPGEARPIATGAMLPEGVQGVLRRESGRLGEDGMLRSERPVRIGADLRYAAEEAARGDELLPAGTWLKPSSLALLAAAGHDEVSVVQRPDVVLLVLGDELADAGVPDAGRVRDVFTPALPAALGRLGSGRVRSRRVGDRLDATVAALEAATARATLVVTTGGSSHGPVDHARAAAERLGGVAVFDGVALRPGHPVMLHRLPGPGPGPGPAPGHGQGARLVLSLPGNPLAGLVCLALLGAPVIAGMSGRPAATTRREPAATDIANPRPEVRVMPCVRTGGGLVPTAWQGSAMLRGIAAADVLALIPPGGVQAGEPVEVVEPA